MNEIEALLLLTTIPHLGSIRIRLLIQYYGSAVAALQATPTSLAEIPGFGPKILQAWEEGVKQEIGKYQLDLAERQGIQVIPYTSPNYPQRLLEITDYPPILYVKGQIKTRDQRCLAVVGTRHASIYGLEMARNMSRELAQAGFTVVSGLARGVDTAAHEGALMGGRTISVLGSGIGHIYPKENSVLAQTITEQGALISEFPISTPPDRQHFPQRNRIVSGMTMGTILIEAPKQSGAMITIGKALDQGRPIFALPGRADQENFKGNHDLIKQRKAELVEDSADIVAHFDHLFGSFSFKPSPSAIRSPLEPEEEELMRQLPSEELSIEDIMRRTQLPIMKLNVLLMSLVLKKVIKEFPGKFYKKI